MDAAASGCFVSGLVRSLLHGIFGIYCGVRSRFFGGCFGSVQRNRSLFGSGSFLGFLGGIGCRMEYTAGL